jgi:hypothetical protein
MRTTETKLFEHQGDREHTRNLAEGFNERLCHAVGLRAADWREARNEAHADREVDRFMGSIAAAVVREPLDGMRQSPITKASFDAFHHQIPDHLPGNAAGAGAHGRRPLFVRRIQGASPCDAMVGSAIRLEIRAENGFACAEYASVEEFLARRENGVLPCFSISFYTGLAVKALRCSRVLRVPLLAQVALRPACDGCAAA